MRKSVGYILTVLLMSGCGQKISKVKTSDSSGHADSMEVSDFWKSANVYFLLTDRFYNGDVSNDLPFARKKDGAVLRSFEGGDLKGITMKIEEGYFTDLGIDAIWMTPVVEQIHGSTDEGTGKTWAYHGYWAKDWTALDPNFGSKEDYAEMLAAAHERGIRILMDVVINHTGPVTDIDEQWPDSWVRTGPRCTYSGMETTVACTLVDNLPDIRTESNEPVALPEFLRKKWQEEGRLDAELASLDAFFEKTGYPRAPRFYLIKWVTDWVREFGIDGFRIDTAKHTEAEIWGELKTESEIALEDWRKRNPSKKMDNEAFYMVGEVYNYFIEGGRVFDYGDRKVDFFNNGFESLINFSFKQDAASSYEEIFSKYSTILNGGSMDGLSILNYISSHDDGSPFDKDRTMAREAATKLLLCPGGVQTYYGDESARDLVIAGTQGDATLRSFMNWDAIESDKDVQELMTHWQKLGQFRRAHRAVGAGVHEQIQGSPYVFRRTLASAGRGDRVAIGLDLPIGPKTIPIGDTFADGSELMDHYSGQTAKVRDGQLIIDTPHDILLLDMIEHE